LIDDKPAFLAGARDAGMGAILYENPAQVRQELEKLGVHAE
jgi:hypothetical protein